MRLQPEQHNGPRVVGFCVSKAQDEGEALVPEGYGERGPSGELRVHWQVSLVHDGREEKAGVACR